MEHGAFVHGPAGTGKSRFAKELLALLGTNVGERCVLVGAPTGVAANVLSGMTLHCLFDIRHSSTVEVVIGIPTEEAEIEDPTDVADPITDKTAKVKKTLEMQVNALTDLKENSVRALQERWLGVRLLLVDEAMMPAADLLANCEERCKERCCTPEMLRMWDDEKAFGGALALILVGDPTQLPPVGGQMLCANTGSRGQAMCRSIIDKGVVVHLTKQMRQDGNDPLVPILTRMKVGECTPADAALLNKSVARQAPVMRRVITTKNARTSSARTAEVDAHNRFMLRKRVHETGQPALHIRQAKKGKAVLGGVPKDAFFQRGARAMVLRNKNVAGGIVNGLCGWLWDVGWLGFWCARKTWQSRRSCPRRLASN